MNWKEFFTTEEFKQYRQMELKAGTEVIGDLIKGSKTPDYVKGAAEMLNKILLVPNKAATGKQAGQLAQEMTSRDLEELKVKVLKNLTRVADGQ